jgi:membrane protease YdiL (CAAX protease family)
VKALFVIGGCVLLVTRPALIRAGSPTLIVTVLFAALLVAALRMPVASSQPRLAGRVAVVLLFGIAVFAVGRVVGGGHPPSSFTARVVALNSLAAVAEEAFFRRVVYAVLAPAGAAIAVGGAAALFALVHLATYGAWVLPIDAAAGLVLGWQRWATGSWSVPAATHVVANVFVVV